MAMGVGLFGGVGANAQGQAAMADDVQALADGGFLRVFQFGLPLRAAQCDLAAPVSEGGDDLGGLAGRKDFHAGGICCAGTVK